MKTRNCTLTRSRNGIETAPVRARRARMPVNFGPEGGSHPSSFGRIASIQDRVLSIPDPKEDPYTLFSPSHPARGEQAVTVSPTPRRRGPPSPPPPVIGEGRGGGSGLRSYMGTEDPDRA